MHTDNDLKAIKHFLDKKVVQFNTPEYIETDPIQVPHRFSRKEDIEISAFLTATIAWGNRKAIIKNAGRLMEFMDHAPGDFLMEADAEDWKRVEKFVHRTFNGNDCLFFLHSLKNIYTHHEGLEAVFTSGYNVDNTVFGALKHFREIFLSIPHDNRVTKHISSVVSNSSAKRLNMYLRWLVRSDENEVDFGLWNGIPMSALMLPLDVHSGNVSRALGLLRRTQNDWKAVEEITAILRTFDPADPVKYDYALFGIGVFKDTDFWEYVPGT